MQIFHNTTNKISIFLTYVCEFRQQHLSCIILKVKKKHLLSELLSLLSSLLFNFCQNWKKKKIISKIQWCTKDWIRSDNFKSNIAANLELTLILRTGILTEFSLEESE